MNPCARKVSNHIAVTRAIPKGLLARTRAVILGNVQAIPVTLELLNVLTIVSEHLNLEGNTAGGLKRGRVVGSIHKRRHTHVRDYNGHESLLMKLTLEKTARTS